MSIKYHSLESSVEEIAQIVEDNDSDLDAHYDLGPAVKLADQLLKELEAAVSARDQALEEEESEDDAEDEG